MNLLLKHNTRNHLLRFSALALVAVLCSCASTSVKKTWKSPESTHPVSKIAVLAVDERGDVRRVLEGWLAAEIQKRGTSAILSSDHLSLADINQDKKAAAERLKSAGADAILIMRLHDIASSYRESRPGPERYAETITGYEHDYWYGYYTVAYTEMSPTYGNLKQKVYLETLLFDLGTAKCLWSGLTLTVVTENMDRLAEVGPLTAKVVDAMAKDGVLP